MFKAGRVPVIPFDLFLWGALKLLHRFPLEGLLEMPGEREEEGKEEEEEGVNPVKDVLYERRGRSFVLCSSY